MDFQNFFHKVIFQMVTSRPDIFKNMYMQKKKGQSRRYAKTQFKPMHVFEDSERGNQEDAQKSTPL